VNKGRNKMWTSIGYHLKWGLRSLKYNKLSRKSTI